MQWLLIHLCRWPTTIPISKLFLVSPSFQAEAEELAIRVQSLTAENLTLRSEINKLMENAKKLKLDNAALMV